MILSPISPFRIMASFSAVVVLVLYSLDTVARELTHRGVPGGVLGLLGKLRSTFSAEKGVLGVLARCGVDKGVLGVSCNSGDTPTRGITNDPGCPGLLLPSGLGARWSG